MLEKITRDGTDTGFFKHKGKMPRDVSANPNILVIQIHLTPKDPGENASDLAQKLHELLSVIDSGVLIELKKLLPEKIPES